MSYLFTSESVSEGHPDKVADQISDAFWMSSWRMTKFESAASFFFTTGQVVLAGEVSVRCVCGCAGSGTCVEKIGYSEYQFEAKSCGVFSSIRRQSGDINRGVERADPYEQGARRPRYDVRLCY